MQLLSLKLASLAGSELMTSQSQASIPPVDHGNVSSDVGHHMPTVCRYVQHVARLRPLFRMTSIAGIVIPVKSVLFDQFSQLES